MTNRVGLVSLCMILAALLLAAGGGPEAAEKKFLGKGPIVITASTLSADNKANTAVFEGSVVAKTEEMTLYSDRMTVHYSTDGAVETIDAVGKVRLQRGEQVVTSGKALYVASEQKVIFTESPKGVKGSNVVTGTKITYLIDEDRSTVENSKVFLERSER